MNIKYSRKHNKYRRNAVWLMHRICSRCLQRSKTQTVSIFRCADYPTQASGTKGLNTFVENMWLFTGDFKSGYWFDDNMNIRTSSNHKQIGYLFDYFRQHARMGSVWQRIGDLK